MKIVKEIFRSYDIRGIYEKELTNDLAYLIGRAFATISNGTIIVGHDARTSSNALNTNFIKGALKSGAEIIDIGLCTTPMLYYAREFFKKDYAVMITASHCAKEYNGFKMSYNGIHNCFGNEVAELYYIILNGIYSKGNGSITDANIKEDYIKMINSHINMGSNKLKVIYDCGNGTTSIVAKDIFVSNDNIEYIPLFAESDGTFPNHHPDPAVESNLTILKEKVKELNADCGIAFDGDGDRVGVVNEKGEFVSIDKFMVIIWRDIYNKIDKKEGFYDVKCSKVVSDEMIKLGLKPIEVRTGNSYTKKISVDNNYPFGGELSGHLYFRDKFIGTDDGIYAGLRLVEILSHNPKKVSKLLEGITKYYNYPEGKFTVEDSKKDIIVSRVEEYCKEKGYNYSKIDGIKVLYDDGFALVRKSNTGPNITTRYESSDKEKLELIKQEFDSLIIKYSKE